MHLRRDGRYLDAVKEFKKAGGTHFVLCQYPMPHKVIKEKSYQKCYQETIKMAEEIKKNIEITVYTTVGPYPVDYIKIKEKYSRQTAKDIMKKGMEEAAELCKEKKSIGIGEIGRPHFKVDEETMQDSNEILSYGMQIAKEIEVPVILHTESTTPENCREFKEMGRKVGLRAEKIVKHYSPPLILENENHGIMPSVLSSKKNITAALEKGNRFMMETDYIDDLRRPGAVLSPKTVPKRTKNLIEKQIMTQEDAYKIHVENPEKTYNIKLKR